MRTQQNAVLTPANGAMVKTIVTSELGTQIASHYGIETMDTLTGFKYIAEKIAEFEQSNSHTFVFGYEESYGYLVETFVRDKDAVQVALKVAEMAAYYTTLGKTLLDALNDLYEQFGYYKEALVSKQFEGKQGQEQMKDILNNFRQQPPTDIAGYRVAEIEDYLSSESTRTDGTKTAIALPKENVLKFILEDGSWIAIRPSGTEPKCKFYYGVVKDTKETANYHLEQLKKFTEV